MFSEDDCERAQIENHLWPLLRAAEIGTLNSEFRHLLTRENLLYKFYSDAEEPSDPDWGAWRTVIGTAAEHGHLNQIPNDVLESLVTEALTKQGSTVLHLAALNGCLDQLPKSALTLENLFRRVDANGCSPALCAIRKKFFNYIPSDLRKAEYLAQPSSCGWTIFHCAAEGGFLDGIPKSLLTIRTMSLPTYRGITPLHLAARHCHLGQVPMKALTLQTLKLRDSQGNTPLHIASGTSHGLGGIPWNLLCAETLLQENWQGDTVLHILWRDGDPSSSCFDTSIYTPEVLTLEGFGGKTILDYAEKKNKLELIPKERLEAGRAAQGIIF